MFAGMQLIPLALIFIYSILVVTIIHWKKLLDSHLFLSFLLLLPVFFYFLINIISIVFLILNLLKQLFEFVF